jgi:carbon monoxide dehydrogenase subunit G
MQLHLEGDEELSIPRERVYELLTNPDFIAKSLPDAQEVRVQSDGTVEAKMKVGISFVTTNMQVKLKITDKVSNQHARLMAEGSGSGSTMKITSDFDLDGDKPTRMKWKADAEITGLMAGMGSSILKGFSDKKVREIFNGIKRAMETQS